MIRKTSETRPLTGTIVNDYNDSQVNAYSTAYINNLNTYSTMEQRIGTWIDGKPIYRKIIYLSSVSDGNQSYPSGLTNIDNVINVYGVLYKGNDKIPSGFMTDTTNYFMVFIRMTNFTIETRSNNTGNSPAYITIEYTKTTD